jgi:hypothetical protein
VTSTIAIDFGLMQAERQRRLLLSAVGSQPLVADHWREELLVSFSKSPALEAVISQNQQIRERALLAVGKSLALEAFTSRSTEWREQILRSARTSGLLDSLNSRQQEFQDQLLASIDTSRAMERMYRNWKLRLPSGLAEQMVSYQARLIADFASETQVGVVDEESTEAWFGAESWDRLVWEMVTILKCAELMAAGMTAAKAKLGAPFPDAILYLLWIFIAAGELAAHLTKGAPGSQEEAPRSDSPSD